MLEVVKAYSDKWYFGYAFQGAAVLGVIPILMPLMVGNQGGSAAAGIVVAAFYLGQLTAPVWGGLADKLGAFRLIYSLGYVLLLAGMVLFAFCDGVPFWSGLAFVQGAGSAATNTVAAMFIVEYKPQPQWDPRIGWLQTFYGTGQALGLGLAAALQMSPGWGMGLAGLLMVPGWILGRLGLPTDKPAPKKHEPTFSAHALRTPRHGYIQLHPSHAVSLEGLGHLIKMWKQPFGLFTISWLLNMLGTFTIYNLYPLLMKDLFDVGAGASSLTYALAATIGVFAYAPSGLLAEKIGEGPVLCLGMLMTMVSLVGMCLLAYGPPMPDKWLLSQALFVFMPVAWSPLIVAGTAYCAELTTMPQGKALGVFNCTTAVGSVVGALTAGWLADSWGYGVVVLTATVITVLSLALLIALIRDMHARKAAAGMASR